jgi:hypothetical protein
VHACLVLDHITGTLGKALTSLVWPVPPAVPVSVPYGSVSGPSGSKIQPQLQHALPAHGSSVFELCLYGAYGMGTSADCQLDVCLDGACRHPCASQWRTTLRRMGLLRRSTALCLVVCAPLSMPIIPVERNHPHCPLCIPQHHSYCHRLYSPSFS